MKKSILLTFAVSALLVLAGCGGASSSSPKASSAAASSSATTSSAAASSSASSSSAATSSSSAPVVYTGVSITNKTELTAAWHVGDANRQIEITTTPAGNVTKLLADGTLTIVSSDTTKVAVIGAYLNAVAAGSATITVTLAGNTDTVDITALAPDVDYGAVTLADGMKDGVTLGAHTYISQVKLESFKTGSDGGTYGNFNVTDADGNNKTIVYGATTSVSALAYNATTKVWKFTNPKDFLSNDATKALKVGDMLDLVYIRCDYGTTKEICGVIIGVNGVAIANRGTTAAPLTSDDVAALTDQQKLYTYYVSGKITAWSGTATDGGTYGNFMLKSDGATGDAITVYGASAAGTLAYNFAKNATVFTNAQDWKTNALTKDLKIGDTVTMQVIRSDYKTTKEIIGIVVPTQAKVDPVISTMTIADANKLTVDNPGVVKIAGIYAENHDTTYGNGYLMDPTTGDSVLVYGCTWTASALAKTDSGLGYYTGTFTNPTDYATKGVTVGSYVEMEAVVKVFNKTVEVMGVLTKETLATDAAYTYTYAASAAAATNGTVALSKESGLTFGEAVTITATPETGYKVDTVSVDHGYGKEKVAADSTGAYAFKANVKNVVTVTFASTTAVVTSLSLTVDTLSQPASAYTASNVQTISGVSITSANVGNYGDGLQFRTKNSVVSEIYNTTATPTAIKSITVTETTGKLMASGKQFLTISAGTAAISAVVDADVVTADGTTAAHTVSYTAAQAMTFFNVGHHSTNSGALYIASIVVELY
jgi:hypothetical protein